MRALLEDDVPEEWLSDSNIQNHNAEDLEPVTSIEERLAEVLQKDEIPEALDFIKCCLRLDPKKRPKAGKCADHEWLSMANACSCCYWRKWSVEWILNVLVSFWRLKMELYS